MISFALLFSALTIFLMRIADVTLGTLRITMLVRGHRLLAGGLGFVESMIWLLAAAQVIGNLDSPIKMVAYCAGFSAGTMLGSTIEKLIAMGSSMVRIVSPVDSPQAAPALRQAGFLVTVLNAQGRDGDVRMSFSVVPRRRIPEVLRIIHEANPNAFVTFEEVTRSRLELLPLPEGQSLLPRLRSLRPRI